MSDPDKKDDLLAMATSIVAAYVSNNSVATDQLPDLIRRTYQTLKGMHTPDAPHADRPQPAVPIRKSVTPDYLICLEDGKKMKMLKRHLKTAYNMTPEEYRLRWGLPADYPMVAPNYARHRSHLAHNIGLGKQSGKRGRPKKSAG